MATMKISDGPRYQKTGSPSQKKNRRVEEIMTLVMNDALSSMNRKVRRATVRKDIPRAGA